MIYNMLYIFYSSCKYNYYFIIKLILVIYCLFLIFFLTGCSNSDTPSENIDINEHVNNNLNTDNKVIKNINNMMKANYDYNHVATAFDGKLIYNGTNFDNISKGTKYSTFSNTTINYQIENYQCFDPITKEPIFNVLAEGESTYLILSELKSKLENTTCDIREESATCSDGYITYDIIFKGDYLRKISIDISNASPNFINYDLNYSNINDTKIIKKLHSYNLVEFNSTNNDNKTLNKIEDNIFGYNINDVNLIFMNEDIEIDFQNILKITEYADNMKEYIGNIKKYIFDDYVVFIKFFNKEKIEKIIVGKIDNSNEILEIIYNIR